jgi:hypothetical protein
MLANVNTTITNMINSPVRKLQGRVEVYEGSTLLLTCNCDDNLKEFNVERVGDESKFFGFGVCQKLKVKLIDKNRTLNLSTANNLRASFGAEGEYVDSFPSFNVSQVYRDGTTNELSITAYDALYKTSEYTVADLPLQENYTIESFALAIADFMGLDGLVIPADKTMFALSYVRANFDNTDTLRSALDAIAEATQTIYFLDTNNALVFKKLDKGSPVLVIEPSKYFNLDVGDNKRLATIVSATELGDNVSVSTVATGSTQYVRNNPFWELREDIDTILKNAIAAVGGMTIQKFECDWRGNPLLEIGDRIALITRDRLSMLSYVLNDVISYDGGMSQKTQWNYEDNDSESAANPASLGEALNQTFARVDKVNRTVTIVASETAEMNSRMSSIEATTSNITLSVQNVETSLDNTNESIATLSSRVDAIMTEEDVRIEIQKELVNGIDQVTTTTGFTFNDEGLTVSKSGSEMTTQITEDGMTVSRDSNIVLTANNEGVQATNLHAVTYLIIGTNSRFEDYGNRTGCFWIGG